MDIQLPCGGGLDILLIPNPDRSVLAKLSQNRAQRLACSLHVDIETGAMQITSTGPTQRDGNQLTVRFEPDIRFLVFGKGPEASNFAALAQSAGYPNLLFSPDDETLHHASIAGCQSVQLHKQAFPKDVAVDNRTAIVLFFHDHDWEPPILAGALETSAFYIGAQGSQRARDARLEALQVMGVKPGALAQLHGPVGLIPSARDAGTLAVSVLAEVLDKAMNATSDKAE
jgi:xanthine dehydrogenase accessory factor